MQTMFVITGLPREDHRTDPDFGLANNAAVQAVRTTIHLAPLIQARTVYLGSNLRGYIRGRAPGNLNPAANIIGLARRTLRPHHDDYLNHPVYDAAQQQGQPDHIVPHPAVLQHSWNTTDRLVELAQRRWNDDEPENGIYPDALLTHDGRLVQPQTPKAVDGTKLQHSLMQDIADAQYRVDYVRTLMDYPARMAIQLAWE